MEALDFNDLSAVESGPVTGGSEVERLQEKEERLKKAGKYLEAEKVYLQIEALKKKQRQRKTNVIRGRQGEESKQMEARHMKEYNDFRAAWKEKMNEFQESAQASETELIQMHKEEEKRAREEIEMKIPIQPKFSPTCLELRDSAVQLANRKEYKQADYQQRKCEKLEAQETKKHENFRKKKIAKLMDGLTSKHKTELAARKKRNKTEYANMKKEMAMAIELMVKKYKNLNNELKVAHQVEENQALGKNTTGAGKNRAMRLKKSTKNTSQDLDNVDEGEDFLF